MLPGTAAAGANLHCNPGGRPLHDSSTSLRNTGAGSTVTDITVGFPGAVVTVCNEVRSAKSGVRTVKLAAADVPPPGDALLTARWCMVATARSGALAIT